MTKKRFKVTDNTDNPFLCDWSVTDYADGGIVHHPMTSENMANVMCDLLNTLNDENEELKDALNQRTEQCDKYYELYGKTEQLKKENRELQTELKYWKMIASQKGYTGWKK